MTYIKDRPKKVGDKIYHNWMIAETKWDKIEKKNKTIVIQTLGNLDDHIINAIRVALSGKETVVLDDIIEQNALLYGNIHVISEKAKLLGLDRILGKHRDNSILMIANRIINPLSKLACVKRSETTYLNNEHSPVNENNLYSTLDRITKNHIKIEDKLYQNIDSKPTFVMYDITSTYVWGDKCPLAEYGHSRDNMPGNKQIVIGLLVDEKGYPISVEVFPGNTADTSTVEAKIIELKNRFGLEEVVLVVDRGMNIEHNLKDAEKNNASIDLSKFMYITACKKGEIKTLMEKRLPQSGLRDQDTYTEIIEGNKRYIVTYNALRITSDKETRDRHIAKTTEAFDKIQTSLQSGRIKTKDELIKRIAIRENKYYAKNCFIINYEIVDDILTFSYSINQQIVDQLTRFDGLYVLVTNILDEKKMTKEELVGMYKQKDVVEKAFEVIKTDISLHPLYHHLESRVEGHVVICFLAYLIEYLLKKDWKDILKKQSFTHCMIELSKIKYLKQYIKIGKDQKKDISKIIGHTNLTRTLYEMAGVSDK